MNFKQFLTESDAIARTNALKQQQELIDAGEKNIEVTKLPGGVYVLTYDSKRSYFCTPDGRIEHEPIDPNQIMTSAHHAYYYARKVLKAPFPAGEKEIATHTVFAYHYAHKVLKAPFPAAEPAIATSAYHAFQYARDVLNGPFPAGEPVIMRSFKDEYEEFLASLKK